jgi:hypothetical protein
MVGLNFAYDTAWFAEIATGEIEQDEAAFVTVIFAGTIVTV